MLEKTIELGQVSYSADKKAENFYKLLKNKVEFYEAGEPVAAIILNSYDPFFVSVSYDGGKKRYMYALTSARDTAYGFDTVGFKARRDMARDIAERFYSYSHGWHKIDN